MYSLNDNLNFIISAHINIFPHMNRILLQFLRQLRLARRPTIRPTPNIHTVGPMPSPIVAADQIDIVIQPRKLITLRPTKNRMPPPPRPQILHQRPTHTQTSHHDRNARLDRQPLQRRRLAPREILLIDLQHRDEAADADADVEDAEAEDQGDGDFGSARHLEGPGCGDGEAPDCEFDGEAPGGDGGDDGDLGEAGAGGGDVPVFGEGGAAEGDDEDGEEDPEDVGYVADEDWGVGGFG